MSSQQKKKKNYCVKKGIPHTCTIVEYNYILRDISSSHTDRLAWLPRHRSLEEGVSSHYGVACTMIKYYDIYRVYDDQTKQESHISQTI